MSRLPNALERLRRNRLARASVVIVCVMAVLGYCAPLVAAHVTHFSLDEQHTVLKSAPPLSRDVSFDHPTYDGDLTSFQFLDKDGSGAIECFREPISRVVLPGLRLMDNVAPTMARQVRERIEGLDAKLPVSSLLRHQLGVLRCPELDEATAAMRFFSFLFETYDGRDGAPDGWLTATEVPARAEDVPESYRKHGIKAHGLFNKLDLDEDGAVDKAELLAATRYLRHDKHRLVEGFDRNRDLRISRDEYPGAPELHTFWLGTDPRGRDLLTRLLYGARISITIGLLATLISFVIGVTYGGIAGYVGGRTDFVMMAVVDVLYGLPFMFIVILLIVIAGRSTVNLFIALGAVQWLTMSRVVRGQILSLKQREFVEAARALGVKSRTIIWRHLLPNTVGPVVVYSTLMVPAVILEEAFLSFLGLGVQPPEPSWGNLIAEGAQHISDHPWLILYPGIALGLTLFCLNFLGDGIRDALDPQAHRG